jgi:hypothetical protein
MRLFQFCQGCAAPDAFLLKKCANALQQRPTETVCLFEHVPFNRVKRLARLMPVATVGGYIDSMIN